MATEIQTLDEFDSFLTTPEQVQPVEATTQPVQENVVPQVVSLEEFDAFLLDEKDAEKSIKLLTPETAAEDLKQTFDLKRSLSQFQLGFQEGQQKVGEFIGVDTEKELAALAEQDPPQTGQESFFRLAGEFSPVGPGGFSPIQPLVALGPRIVAQAAKTGQSIPKVVENVGKFFASLKGAGFNEKVAPVIKQNPELVFKPKKGWQAIHNGVFDFIKKEKTRLGEKLGSVKKKISTLIQDNVIESDDIVGEMSQFDDLFPEGSTVGNTFKQIKNLVSSGGESVNKPKFKTITDPAEVRKLITSGVDPTLIDEQIIESIPLNVDSLGKIIDGIEDTAAFEAMSAKAAKGAAFNFKPSEMKLLRVKDFLKSKSDELIQTLDDEALSQGLISAKGEYANLARQNRLIGGKGGISSKQVAKNLKRSLAPDNENEFDAFREILPDDLFNEAISFIINDTKSVRVEEKSGRVFRPFERAKVLGSFLGRKTIESGGLLAGGTPQSPIGKIPTALIEARFGLGRGVASGLNAADKATRILTRGRIIQGLGRGVTAELTVPTEQRQQGLQ